jgi:hypothetical protein
MELLEGAPITRFCDQHRLPLRERLVLFAEVCGAIQHAHQKGVIHRDLKPSNILVTLRDGKPFPKIIDFGIAKAVTPTDPDDTALTWAHQVLGTPAYMSPEQADGGGLDVDTRTDIYSLGVILYELLCGQTPFDGQELLRAGMREMRRLICEVEPPVPSARVVRLNGVETDAVSGCRATVPERLARQLRGDLDWIAARAIQKDRALRYQSAGELEQDITRHLANQPVSAAAPSLAYRMGKFVRRHRSAVAVGLPMLGLFAVGVAASAHFAVRAMRSDRELLGEAAVTQALNQFLTEDVLSQADPDAQPDRDIRLRTVLDRASARVGERFEGRPLVEAAIRCTLGEAYENLGEYGASLPHYRRAYELRFHELGESHRKTLEAMSDLALAHSLNRDHGRARELGARVFELARARLGEGDAFTAVALCRLAQIAFADLDRPGAHWLSREALDLCRRVEGVPVGEQVLALHVYARSLGREGSVDEGERHLREALSLARSRLGEDHPKTLAAMSWLAAYLYDHRRSPAEIESICLDALERSRRTLGEGHIRTLILRNNLALLYRYNLVGRMQDAVHHQMIMLRYKRPPLEAGEVGRLRELIDSAPPGTLADVARLRPDRWSATTLKPAGAWTRPSYSAASWVALPGSAGTLAAVPAEGDELWLRQEFDIDRLPEVEPVVLLRSDGRWDVHVNGVPLPAAPAVDGTERLQVFFFDEAARNALRQGVNVLALHGSGLPEGEFIDVLVVEIPQPRPRQDESSGAGSG